MKFFDLSGKWNGCLDSDFCGKEKKFYSNKINDFIINLPGTVSEQKLSPPTDFKSTGYLTDPFLYEGWVWFQKTIDLTEYENLFDSSSFELILERTRISTVWIDDKEIGTDNSLCGIHRFNITELVKPSLTITVLIDNKNYPTKGGHMTSPDTQTNWNGIIGKIGIQITSKNHIANTIIRTEAAETKKLLIKTTYTGTNPADYKFSIENLFSETKPLQPGLNELSFELPEETKLWSDTNPNLYQLVIESETENDRQTFTVGVKTFAANGKYFEINGKRIFLRGKHDGMIFPETGFAPGTKEEWLKVMKTAKEYGINHYRFHTCCPPQAAFEAADELGIYMAPELPFWGTIQAPGEEGFNESEQNYLIQEGFNILKDFGNHPSFVMMSMGNELWGSEQRLDDIMKGYKEVDSYKLYTGGSNNFQFWPRTTEHEDYFSGVRFSKEALIRGSYAMCDAPLGFVQTDEPNTNHNYDIFFNSVAEGENTNSEGEQEIEIQYGTGVKKVKTKSIPQHFLPGKPCISHEVGQYCMYPDFNEIKRYHGVLKPYNLEEFKNRCINAGLESQADDFFRDSSRLAVQCYKTEIEAALRSNELSGFQLLDIQDFTGQGTALVGILNSFMESKNVVTGKQWKSFCGETVLLGEFSKFVYEENEELSANIIFHNYSDKNYKNEFVTAYIVNTEDDEILCEENFLIPENIRGNQLLGNFKYNFEGIKKYTKLALLLVLAEDDDKSIINSYMLHIYPAADKALSEKLEMLKSASSVEIGNCIITKDVEEARKIAASKTKKVILMPETIGKNFPGLENPEKPETIEGTYCTDFWCYPMFRSISESVNRPVPVGTLGLTINPKDTLLKNFPTDSYTTPKWYNIISHSTCVNIDRKILPAVQMIDNFERNWKLGIIYETENMIICTSRLWEISDKPEVTYLVNSLLKG